MYKYSIINDSDWSIYYNKKINKDYRIGLGIKKKDRMQSQNEQNAAKNHHNNYYIAIV